MTLAEKIARAIDLKQGNKEFALFYHPDVEGSWSADIGNDCPHVMLGEAAAEFSFDGNTAEEAVDRLIAALQEGSKS